jgi:hypothetical protein
MTDEELEKELLLSISIAPPSLFDPRMFMLLGIEWRRNRLRGWIGIGLAISAVVLGHLYFAVWSLVGR